MGFLESILLLVILIIQVEGDCVRFNWRDTFNREGVSKCADYWAYINGFVRQANGGDNDNIDLIDEAECCLKTPPWRFSDTSSLIQFVDWSRSFDHDNTWNSCPSGYFLTGLYRSESSSGKLSNIEEGKCVKPADHPPSYGQCYNHDVSTCFNNAGLCRCENSFYITGLYRGSCDKLHCLDKFRCCQMRENPETLDEVYKVKERIMDKTLFDMASLGHYLGYGWALGCRAIYVGEDFRRRGEAWQADQSGRCSGYKNNERFGIQYGNWSFALKDIRYGNPVISDLQPETVDTGPVYNDDISDLSQTVEREETIVNTVTHRTSTSWKNSYELGVTVSYSSSVLTPGAGFSSTFSFGYEGSTTRTDSEGTDHSRTFTVTTAKTLSPHTASRWKVIISKTRTTVPYTATIIAKFSAEFTGFLRHGGGYYGNEANYHYQHRGSHSRPTYNHLFGDANTPFYTALKRNIETNSRPWMWSDLKNKHQQVNYFINRLTDESFYEFQLTGYFDEVVGKHVEVRWDAIDLPESKRSVRETPRNKTIHTKGTMVAMPSPYDPPPPNPEPPKVDLDSLHNTGGVPPPPIITSDD